MKLSGARILIEELMAHGVDVIFGYPGGVVLNIYDELYKASDKIKHYITAHEQGAAHAADGYARVTGKTGVCIATSGPGATNLVTGIANAYLDSTPMVAITGNVATGLLGRDSFQEIDITGVTMPITKHNFIVKDVTRLSDIIRQAFLIAKSGRCGPVLIDIPKDIQVAVCDYELRECLPVEKNQESYLTELKTALSIIKQSKKPFIYAGGGVVAANASEQLEKFAELIDAPIGTSMMGISAVNAESPRVLGMTGMHGKFAASKVMSVSDLIIAVGSRFSDRATGNKQIFVKSRKIIHIDIDPAELGKNIAVDVPLLGDVKEVLTSLNNSLEPVKRDSWQVEIEKIRNSFEASIEMDKYSLNPQTLIECVNTHSKADTIVATDVGQHQMWTTQYYKIRTPRTFLTSGGLGTMGFGLGAAIGGAIGSGRKTVLFTSDGCFHMNMNEMATAVSNNLPIVIVLLNNNALGMVRQWQTTFYEKRYSNTTLNRKTDYVALARAFGAEGRKITNLDELESALKWAFECNSPVLIEAIIDSDAKVLPFIPPGCAIDDIILKE